MSVVSSDDVVERESRFDRWMLSLSRHHDPATLVTEVLRFVAEDARASLGYLELFGGKGPPYVRAVGTTATEIEAVQALLSQTIVRRTLIEGRTIATPAAVADPRFAEQGSVRQNTIHAALCVPICEENEQVVGVLYLQRDVPGTQFDETVRARLHTFAIVLALVADRLIRREAKEYRRQSSEHAVAVVEAALRRNKFNAAAASRELGMSRATLYRILARKHAHDVSQK